MPPPPARAPGAAAWAPRAPGAAAPAAAAGGSARCARGAGGARTCAARRGHRHRALDPRRRTEPGGHLLVAVAVGHDHDHRLRLLVGDQAVHDQAGAAHVEPRVLVAAGAVQQVQHRVGLLAVFVAGGRVDVHAPLELQRRRVVPHHVHVAVRDVADLVVLRERPVDEEDVRVPGAVPADVGVARVERRDAVHREGVAPQLRRQRSDGGGPHAVGVLHHLDGPALGPVAAEGDLGGVRRAQAERHGVVRLDFGRHDARQGLHARPGSRSLAGGARGRRRGSLRCGERDDECEREQRHHECECAFHRRATFLSECGGRGAPWGTDRMRACLSTRARPRATSTRRGRNCGVIPALTPGDVVGAARSEPDPPRSLCAGDTTTDGQSYTFPSRVPTSSFGACEHKHEGPPGWVALVSQTDVVAQGACEVAQASGLRKARQATRPAASRESRTRSESATAWSSGWSRRWPRRSRRCSASCRARVEGAVGQVLRVHDLLLGRVVVA